MQWICCFHHQCRRQCHHVYCADNRTNAEKSLQNKKRVIQMLFVVVLEFFICWTPLYVINTIASFEPHLLYQNLGIATFIPYVHLLAYSSGWCNPITYCFMNRGFRKAFLNLFRCLKRFHGPRRMSIGGVVGGTTIIIGNGAANSSEADTNRIQAERLYPNSFNRK